MHGKICGFPGKNVFFAPAWWQNPHHKRKSRLDKELRPIRKGGKHTPRPPPGVARIQVISTPGFLTPAIPHMSQ